MHRGYGVIAAGLVVALLGTGLASEERVLPVGEDHVSSLALSPTGALLAAGTSAGSVFLWRVQSGELLWQAGEHAGFVEALDWNTDGTVFASGAEDGTVRLWEVGAGRSAHVLTAPKLRVLVRFFDPRTGEVQQEEDEVPARVQGVAWSPKGTVIAAELFYPVGSGEKTVVLWDVTNGEELRTVVAHGWVSFNPTGTAFATWDEWGVTVWDTRSGRELGTFEGCRSAAWNPTGMRLAVASEDHVSVWDGGGDERLVTLDGRGFVLWSPDGRFLVTDSSRGWALWDAGTGQEVWSLGRRPGLRPVFSPDGEFLVTALPGTSFLDAPKAGGVRVVHVRTGTIIADREVPYPGPGPLALGSGSVVAYGVCTRREIPPGSWGIPKCLETGIALWDCSLVAAVVHGLVASMQGQLGSASWVGFTPDGGSIVSTSSRSRIAVWDASTRRLLVDRLSGHNQGILRAALSPDRSFLATTGVFWDKTVQVWDLATGACVATVRAPWDVKSVAWSPDGTRIALGSIDGAIRFAETGTWTEAGLFSERGGVALDLAFAPSGRILAAALGSGIVTVCDLDGQVTIATLRGHTGPVGWVAFSPDGSLLASASGKEVKLWATTTWEEVGMLARGVSGPLAFDPEGRLLAMISSEAKAEVWSLETFERLAVVGLGSVRSVAFSPDGLFLATGHADGSVLVWDVGLLLER